MIKKLLIVLICLAPLGANAAIRSVAQQSASVAVLMATPVLSTGCTGCFPSNSATNYIGVVEGASSGSHTTTAANRQMVTAVAGTYSGLEVVFPQGIGSGSYAVTLMDGASATALTCTVSSGTTCSDSSHSVSVAVGDLLEWRIVPAGTPTTQTAPPLIGALFTSTVGQESPIFGGTLHAGASNGVNNFTSFGATNAYTATETLVSNVVPVGGTIDTMYVSSSGNPGGGGRDYTITLMHNGSTTTLACTLPTSGSTCNDTNLGHAVTIAAGDTISIQTAPTGTPTSIGVVVGVRWVPTTQNQALFFATAATVPGTSTTANYLNMNGQGVNNTTETSNYNVAPVLSSTMTVGNLYVAQCPGPGGGITRSVTANAGAYGSTSAQTLTATVGAGTTACPTYSTATNNSTFTATSGQVLDWVTSVSGTSTALTQFKIGATVTVP